MNRKGDLTREILGIIIALIGLLIISSIVYKLYNINVNQEEEDAGKAIDSIFAKINALEDGQNTSATVQGFSGAEGWYLVGWNKNDSSKTIKPEMCFDTSCICACSGPTKENCEDSGVCKSLDLPVLVYTEPFVGGEGEFSSAMYPSCIPFLTNLIEVKISKAQSELIISSVKPDQLNYGKYLPCSQLPEEKRPITDLSSQTQFGTGMF